MKKMIQEKIFAISEILELVLAVGMIIVLGGMSISLFKEVITPDYLAQDNVLNLFLEQALGLVIGFEFLRMLVKPTASNVIEVLLFTTARQIVINHGSTLDNLAGIACVAGIFATRKYLFCHFGDIDRMVFSARRKLGTVNSMLETDIPGGPGRTLAETLREQLEEEGLPVEVGARAGFGNVVLRVESMHGEEITRVEVIKYERECDSPTAKRDAEGKK